MKRVLILVTILLISSMAAAQQVKFPENGKLKIAQFTDTHLSLDTEYKRGETAKAMSQLCYILDTEKPNVVIFTGDVVTGRPAREAWVELLDEVSERSIPFGVVFGNHDCEQELSKEELSKLIMSYPLALNVLENGVLADDAVEVLASRSDKIAALLYLFDSNEYSTIDSISGYGWFEHEQVKKYRDMSLEYSNENGGKAYPALAFFHIPLNEYVTAARDGRNPKYGIRGEDECPPAINTGMFAAFLERGDVFGTFVGHDHNNDYIVGQYGVALVYGRFSGYNTTYTDLRRGVRIIELLEGRRCFETWIHERDGLIINHIRYEDNKMKKFEKYPL